MRGFKYTASLGFSAITSTYVEVTFDAVAEAMEDVTIEVKDNTGAVVEVKPVNLVKGETVATFTFTKALTEEPEGVWNVAGITVDLDLEANLKAVYNYTNQVTLLEGLNKLGLTDVKADNIAFYEAELAKITDSTKDTYVALEDFTVEVAQKVVTDGNAEALKAVDEEAVVKAVNEAKTQVALLEALAPFERVNADWIAQYETAVDTANTPVVTLDTAKKIQAEIDTVNGTELGVPAGVVATTGTTPVGKLTLDGTNDSIVKKDLSEAKALVTAYMIPDAEGVNTKAELLRKIDRQLAIVAVLDAETPAQLSVAMNNLKAVDAAYELNMDNYKDANRADYITELGKAAVLSKNTISGINTILEDVNAAQAANPVTEITNIGKTITDVTAAVDTTKQAALLKALKANSALKYVTDANAEFYYKLATTAVSGTNENAFAFAADKGDLADFADPAAPTAAEVKTANNELQALVDKANLAAIDGAADADKTYAALVAYGNDIKDLSVNNKAQYHTAFNGKSVAAGAVQVTVDGANIAALQAQTTADGVLAKLNIMTQVKNVKAENAKAYLDSVKDTVTAGSLGNATTTTVGAVQTAIDTINAAGAATAGVKAVNDATTATELRDILTELVVDGDITAGNYLDLTNADKLIVAELFMDDDVFDTTNGLIIAGRTNLDADDKYQALNDIGTDLDALAGAVDGLRTTTNGLFATKAVGSVTISSVQAELAKLVKANYTAYDALTGTQKLAAAEAFIAAFPVNADGDTYLAGYTTFGAYLDAVDAAIQ